jgi:hydrogenase/urease accessory protein HupE
MKRHWPRADRRADDVSGSPNDCAGGHRKAGLMKRFVVLWALIVALTVGATAVAHEVRPALVQITQRDAHHYDILWKQPVNGEVAVHLVPQLSGGGLDSDPDIATVTPAFALKLWKNVSDESQPLEGQTLTIQGLDRTITDVLVNITLSDGQSIQQFLKPNRTSVQLQLNAQAAPPATAYLSLGVEHILTGIDHLLFVFGLLLLVGRNWALLKTITAFTIAHSITLAATTLGLLHIQPAVVEALVALSIVTLAVELVRREAGVIASARGSAGADAGQSASHIGLTSRYPWLIAFVFGLLHGCAFAGSLAEVGLPQEHIPLALFLFNVGVELGQLLFIAAASAVLWLAGRGITAEPLWARRTVPYAIGIFSSYWFIERFLIAIGHSA